SREWSNLSAEVQRVSYACGMCQSHESIDEGIVDRAMNESSRSRDARLPGRCEDSAHHSVHGLIEASVVEHNVRRLSSELQRHAFHSLRCLLINGLSGS